MKPFKNKNSKDLDIFKNRLNASPYYRLLGMKVISIKDGKSKVEIEFKKDLLNILGTVHAGAMSSIADAAGALAVSSLLDEGQWLVTIELKINFLIPFKEGKLVAHGKAIYKGSKIGVAEVELMNNDNLIAKAMVTLMVRNLN